MMKVLLYAYASGVLSSRKMAAKLREGVAPRVRVAEKRSRPIAPTERQDSLGLRCGKAQTCVTSWLRDRETATCGPNHERLNGF